MKNTITILAISSLFVTSCGSGTPSKEAQALADSILNAPVSNAQNIKTPGYEGTIEGPNQANIRNFNFIDKDGNATKFPLIEVTDNLSFVIEQTTKTLDSLKNDTEKSEFDKFVNYAEKGDNYFIARTVKFMGTDTLFVVGYIASKGTKNYQTRPDVEITKLADAKLILDYAKTYKRN